MILSSSDIMYSVTGETLVISLYLVLIGPRRITETINLSDLTKILSKLKAGEFSLPSGFTLKYRKRFADESKSETFSVNFQGWVLVLNLEGNSLFLFCFIHFE